MADLQPYGREDEIFQYLNQVERNLFEGLGSIFGPFRSEFADKGEAYELKIALPGFRREDIAVEVADGFLTVRAGRKPEPGSEKQAFDGYYRQFTLTGVRADKIGASYRDGLLTVRLPKARPEDGPQPRRIEIQ